MSNAGVAIVTGAGGMRSIGRAVALRLALAPHGTRLDQAFPLMLKQLELMLISGELNPRYQHCVTLYHNGLTCEADTLGSCGYVYIAIYPEQTEPQ